MNKPLLGTRPEPTKDVGERLRSLRVAAGLTQSDLAEGRFSKEYVSQIERGKTRPTAETLEWLAERLGVDPAYLGSGVSAEERGRVEAALARAEALLEQPDYSRLLGSSRSGAPRSPQPARPTWSCARCSAKPGR